MATFVVNRSLLNSKFEGYKLDLISQEKAVQSYNLKYKPTQATTSSRALLSFQDVQSRITHNHLSISPEEGPAAVYVDADYNVVVIELDHAVLRPECRIIFELPKPAFSPASAAKLASDRGHPQYPSAAFFDASIVFVSDGYGELYVLHVPNGQPAQLLGKYNLRQSSQPFRIHHAVSVSSDHAVLLLSSKHSADPPVELASTVPKGPPRRAPPAYDVWAVRFPLPFQMAGEGVHDLDVLWQRRGDDVPMYAAFDASHNAFILLGSSLYREIGTQSSPPFQPSPEEFAPIPRRDETLDTRSAGPEKPPPYSWTQSSDSVTVAFPLPSNTPKTSIKITFTPRTLTLHVLVDNDLDDVLLPHYSLKQFWDGIQPSTTFWTWDREAEHAYGLLTLHLDKQHEGTRWTHVFAANPDDVDVPETLDPSELGLIREALEKYTSSLRDGSDTSGLGLGKGVPSLAEGEMDDEVDASVGREVHLTSISSTITTGGSESALLSTAAVKASDGPFVLLSTPLPGSPPEPVSLVIKTGLDGALFRLDPLPDVGGQDTNMVPNANALHWTHTGTYSALAFVLASKQDTRFTHHVGARTVLAFESGSGGRGGNVYIYRSARTGDKWAKQSVLRIGGSLLGVGSLRVGPGKRCILCLTETELVFVHDVV